MRLHPSLRASLFAGAVTALLGLLGACGPTKEEAREGPDSSRSQAPGAPAEVIESADGPATVASPTGATVPVIEGATSAGYLVTVDPEFPDRPLYKQFGNVTFGSDHEWFLELRNDGSEPVRIRTAQEACGCTKFVDYTLTDAEGGLIEDPERPGRPWPFASLSEASPAVVPPGGAIQLRMKLITSYSKVNQQKLALMRLYTDSMKTPFLTMEVGFKPTRTFLFAPDRANLLNAPFSSGKTVRVKVVPNLPGDPGRVLGVVSTPEGIEAELVTEYFAGTASWYVDVTVPPVSDLGPRRGAIVLKTTDENGEGDSGRLELPLIAEVVADVIPSPRLVAFRTFDLTEGASQTGRIAALVPGARIRVLDARFDSDAAELLDVEYAAVKPFDDGTAIEWEYTATARKDYPEGYVSGDLVFVLEESIGGLPEDAPQNEVRVRLSGVAQAPPPEKLR